MENPTLKKLLIVDDEKSTCDSLERLFRKDFEILSFQDTDSALSTCLTNSPDIIITDYQMPKMTGLKFLAETQKICPTAVRVLLSGHLEINQLIDAINLGLVHRVFLKPWDNQVLKLSVLESVQLSEILKEKQTLQNLSITDAVTGLTNHRYFQERLSEELARSSRHPSHFCLLMIDVDHFKNYNDRFGHPAGDKLLKQLAESLKGSLRSIDSVSRYGGEEFAIILPETSEPEGILVAERLLSTVPQPISIGLSSYPKNGQIKHDLISKADQALYLAKQTGRNKLIVAQG